MSDIEKTRPIDVLATRVWSGTHWHYPHIEAMIAEIERLRAENERWQEIIKDEMDETFALYEVMGITDTIKDGTAPTRAITDKAQDMQIEIERLRAEVAEQARLNGMGGERELKLQAEVKKYRDCSDRFAHLIIEADVIPGIKARCKCDECKQTARDMEAAGFLEYVAEENRWWNDTARKESTNGNG